ncbi:hypothetical protein MHO82_08235 [Vibrio sp. Of7-15]|uniref:hypothetical protein n=1 Tax=Vibrio sp. Of7-15 TaxID=2724879 RepID=UPI001EF17B81|nr:hypothetical protein [Vibrio sp. Of7-15]MCG7496848.1 hypothetical protein [Vibrio sp. Of7-15]
MIKRIIHKVIFNIKCLFSNKFNEYHYFKFDINKPLPKGAYRVMNNCCDILSKLDLKYRLTDGTVLGLYREGAFIAHDNDIDVDVFDVNEKEINKIKNEFKKNGYSIGRIATNFGLTQQVVFYNDENIIFDILFWYKNGKKYENFSEQGFLRAQDEKYFNDLSIFNYDNHDYFIPGHIEEWLVVRYGPDWKTPKTYKGDWKDDCFDLEKINE